MKIFYVLIIVLMIAGSSIGQALKPVASKINEKKLQNALFRATSLFDATGTKSKQSNEAARVAPGATVMEFKRDAVQNILADKPENITLNIPRRSGGNVELELTKATIFTPDFSVVTSATDGQPVPYTEGVHYWGIIKGDNTSLAAISVFNDEVMGLISSPSEGNLILGRLEGDDNGRHVLYNSAELNVPSPPTQCFTPDDNVMYSKKDLQSPSVTVVNCIRLYWEVNSDIYTNKGSVTAATNYVTGLFNQSAIIYTNDGIPVALSQVYVWNTTSPYTSNSTSTLLSQFQSYRNSFNGDLGNLLSYKGGGGVAAGFSGFCSSNLDNSQCYSGISSSYSNFPTYSWSVEVVTHEQGHLMGSRHTHACVWNGNSTAIDNCGPTAGYGYEGSCSGAPTPTNGGTIMSYCHLVSSVGIKFSNGFGSQPRTVILNKYNAATCLTACTSTSCSSPTGMSTTGITNTGATFNWTGVSGATSYNVQYRRTGTTTWSTGSTAATTLTVSGLSSAASYEWQVQTVCSSGISAFTASATFNTTGTACNAPTGLTAGSITGTGAVLTWAAATGAVTYNLQWKASSASSWTTVTGLTARSYTLSTLTGCTSYQFQVQTVCSSGSSAYSSATSFTTAGCTVTYCASRGNSTSYEYINRVTIGTINNTSGNNGGYSNYTALSTNLAGGTSVAITLVPGFTGSSYREYWNVWIDYNQNGVFTDAGEKVTYGNSTSALTMTIAIPTTALNGSTRMRVQMQYGAYASSSCLTYTYGEVEDYTVTITGNAQSPKGPDVEPIPVSANIADAVFYPNPAQNNLTIEYNNPTDGSTVRVNVYDLLGNKVMTTDNKAGRGLNTVHLNTSSLFNGIYIFEIGNAEDVQRHRFIISRQ